MSTFTVAGVSKHAGEFKVRYANDMMRVKVLEKNKHTHIDLLELPEAMPKDAIPAYLLKINFDNGNKEVRAAIEAAVAQRSGKPIKSTSAKPKKTTPSMDAIAARARAVKATPQVAAIPGMTPLGITPRAIEQVESEDAPF
jgi:hypothetical protein